MKHIIILSSLVFLCLACQPEAKQNDGEMAVAPENQLASTPVNNDGGVASPVAPDVANAKVQALLKDWWVIEFWVDAKNAANKEAMRGHWMKFFEDGTFISGLWEEETAQGVWAVTMDQNRELLTLDSNNDAEDMQFMMQGITKDSDAMSWAGTRSFDMPHIMCKVIQMGSRPNQEQFEQR